MHREPATYYRGQQQKWAGRMHACTGVFHHWWGVVVALPLVVGGYCRARSLGAFRGFLRTRKTEQGR